MSTRTLPDIEAAVIAYLLTTDVATLVEGRIYADIPAQPAYPFLRVLKVSESDVLHWFAQATIQVEGWANRKNAGSPRQIAREACEAAIAALHDAVNVTSADALLGACTVLNGPRPLYDQPTGNPRFLADVLVPYHPLAS